MKINCTHLVTAVRFIVSKVFSNRPKENGPKGFPTGSNDGHVENLLRDYRPAPDTIEIDIDET